MILEFNQIGRQPNPIFEGKIGDEVVIAGKGATQSNDAYISFGSDKIDISSNPHREKIDGKMATQVVDLLSDGNRIGYVYPDLVEQKKILFLSFGYDYFVFNFNGVDYNAFEVGLGEDKHFICVYNGEETVAIIKKHDEKINYCDKYTIYSIDDTLMLPMSVLAMYFDCIRYPDHGEIVDEFQGDDSFLTTQKELNAKYDPTFIAKVEALNK